MPQVFDQLTRNQLDQFHRDRTVFLFTVGPLEDHGPHLPMGLDGRWAVQLAYRIGLKLETDCPGWTAVLMPPAPLGVDSNTSALALKVRPYVMRDYLVDVCLSLNKGMGFRHFACFSGHLGPKQLTAIEEAGKIVRRRTGAWGWRKIFRRGIPASLVSACSALVTRKEVFRSPFTSDPIEHGGAYDTSLALALDPTRVDPNYRLLGKIQNTGWAWARSWRRSRGQLSGYWGAPAEADAKKGEEALREQVDTLFPKLRAVWEGAPPDGLFRSWYSFLWPNHSFFTVYLLTGVAFLLMIAWFYLALDAVKNF